MRNELTEEWIIENVEYEEITKRNEYEKSKEWMAEMSEKEKHEIWRQNMKKMIFLHLKWKYENWRMNKKWRNKWHIEIWIERINQWMKKKKNRERIWSKHFIKEKGMYPTDLLKCYNLPWQFNSIKMKVAMSYFLLCSTDFKWVNSNSLRECGYACIAGEYERHMETWVHTHKCKPFS
jgi:hypothetical protein